MTAAPRPAPRPAAGASSPALARAARWIWRNLFGSLGNSVLTVLTALLLWTAISNFLDWAVFNARLQPATQRDCIDAGGACWAFIQAKWRLILFGTYTYDQQWRPALALVLLAAQFVISGLPGAWATRARRRRLVGIWLAGLVVIGLLMAGGVPGLPPVAIRLWSGLPLTVLLAVVGMLGCFVISVALALGRQSRMPVLRWLSIVYIEVIRGVPLISLLFMANILVPLILPQDITVPNLVRAQIAFILFFSAYMAETIRGGLQSVPAGQYAAARAVGMGYWTTMIHIILPQALRVTVPSMVNLFIAGFKDTSLVVVISMLDLLGTANAAKADPGWVGLFAEAYFFIAVIYLVVCATMSWYSRRLERRIAASRRT